MAYIRLKRAVKVFSKPFEPHVAESGQKKKPPPQSFRVRI